MSGWWAADGGEHVQVALLQDEHPGQGASGDDSDGSGGSIQVCPGGQYEAESGDCRPCALGAAALWAALACSGAILCGGVWWLGTIALARLAAAKSGGGAGAGAGAGQAVAHGAKAAVKVQHAMTTFSTTTTSFQFLFLFQIHLTWPTIVMDAWHFLTAFASLAWLRLEFLFDAIKPLCANQYVPPAAILVAPFVAFTTIYGISYCRARHKEKQVRSQTMST